MKAKFCVLAEFGCDDLLGSNSLQTHGVSLLQPEVLSHEVGDAARANEVSAAEELTKATHHAFEPAPASSFEPAPAPTADNEVLTEQSVTADNCDVVATGNCCRP